MTPAFTDIDLTVDGDRGELHLNRPEKLNALRPETLHELAEVAEWLNTQPDLKVVLVAGRGRAFSAGADVGAFTARGGEDPGAFREAAEAGRLMADALERVAAVTIAKVHGHCVGGGVVLAATCDIRVAAAARQGNWAVSNTRGLGHQHEIVRASPS